MDPTVPTTTAIAPHIISQYERTTYYHGISLEPPELLYRSDLHTNPFPVPKGRHSPTPTKTAYGVFNTRLNDVWDDVAPQICKMLKARGIQYAAVKAARFLTHGEDGGSLGPIVIWIATHPDTTTAKDAHDISPDILGLLVINGVEGAVIEWYEGAVETLTGKPLLRVTPDTDPTYYLRRFLSAALGMPIATKEREADDAQGSVGFFFHENKTKSGEPSGRVFGITNCHVLRKENTVDYEFRGGGAARQLVRVAGKRRFQRGLDEIRARISVLESTFELLVTDIADLELQSGSHDPNEVAEAEAAVVIKQTKQTQIKEEIRTLEDFYKELVAQWSDIGCRNIGYVDWAPTIAVDVNNYRYTMDLGTFELDGSKFKPNFKGNVFDLGTKYSSSELIKMFYPLDNIKTAFKFPPNGQLRIRGCLTREWLAKAKTFDSSKEPCLIVMKDGSTTGLTVGRYAGLEAHLSDKLGIESQELAIYNYDKQSGDFSAKGDSGSLIFDGMGNMVGILHSGMPRGASSHVTYATPAWWVITKIKSRYPNADFFRTTW